MDISEALMGWNIRDFIPVKTAIVGSPRRTLERHVIESDGRKYILECIHPIRRERREGIAEILESLHSSGSPVEHYLVSHTGRYVFGEGSYQWMLKEYVGGYQLERPKYLNDSWRGSAASDFLLKLREHVPYNMWKPAHLPSFIAGMMSRLERKNPDLYGRLVEPYMTIKEILKKWDSLPHSFTHGDFHPMNIIWGNERINAVIDWEFMGMRPEMYDVAMMLGCLGIEDPDGLFSPFAEEFLKGLKKAGFDAISWEYLPEMILATRFAWMDEWIRNKDENTVSTEMGYLHIISHYIDKIRIYFSNTQSRH